MIKRFLKNKKGEESLIFSPIIFILINVLFFVMLLAFVFKSSSGALVYEQAYAKQIALLIDQAKPGMEIHIDFSEALKIAEDNKFFGEYVKIEDNQVVVKLADKGGYSFKHISNYKINPYFDKELLIITINEAN